jgi:peptidoglycan/LPS O-acetylase OafA/YrhL
MLRKLPLWLPVAAFGTASFFLDHLTEQKLTYFAVFFFLGNLMAHKPDLLARLTRGWVVTVMAVLAVGYGVLSSIEGLAIAYQVVWAPLSVAGILTAIGITRWLSQRGSEAGWLTKIGRNSLVYYVVHFPIMVGTTFALYAVGVRDIIVVSTVNVVIAISVGWLAVLLRSAPPITWLFQAPSVLTEWVRRRCDRFASAPRVVVAG